VETVLAPRAAAAAAALLADVAEASDKCARYFARLGEVRERRAALAAALAAADEEAGDGDGGGGDDAASDAASSAVTGLSAYTERSASGAPTAGSSRPPSTAGGRKAAPRERRTRSKGGKIRQGSPAEEAALAARLGELAPTPGRLADAAGLAEALVLLGHERDARAVQGRLSAWLEQWRAVCAAMAARPAPPLPLPQPPGGGRQEYRDVNAAFDTAPLDAARWKWDLLRPLV
jgi:elongator complex protein 1